ncbi:MAG: CDP-alcohol phosphatidyltransferase family protein [bacterium]
MLSNLRNKLRNIFLKIFLPVIKILVKMGIKSNTITFIGFFFSLISGFLIAKGNFLGAGLLFFVSGLFDLLDGSLARETNTVSKKGALLDSTMDRLSEGSIFFGLLIYFFSQHGLLCISLVFCTFLISYMVSYVRARAEGLGFKCDSGWATRFERMLIMGLFLIFKKPEIGLWILCLIGIITVIQRIRDVLRM